MKNQEAIDILQEKISPCVAGKWKEAVDVAISALQARDSETRKICNTCKHDPPSKKWPCVDCDMREPADRWESKECQTCKHYDDASKKCGECLELGIDNYEPNEMENSKELSKTQKALDTIQSQDVPVINVGDTVSRAAAIDALMDEFKRVPTTAIRAKNRIDRLPSAQPETCEGCKHLGKWENEVEYGYPSPCTRCKRRVEDHYER